MADHALTTDTDRNAGKPRCALGPTVSTTGRHARRPRREGATTNDTGIQPARSSEPRECEGRGPRDCGTGTRSRYDEAVKRSVLGRATSFNFGRQGLALRINGRLRSSPPALQRGQDLNAYSPYALRREPIKPAVRHRV